ncbi:MAG TPA: alcohol dehydrogenase catalytic domain-containing protein [Acidimicrobiales bacterium]|nr:alcohol dehydrogenase catalytic domain-containing protein [Acidimicrobiales bacterium]
MRAVVLVEPGEVEVQTVPDPEIVDPGDAVVAVRESAICGADLFPFHGLTPGFENGTVLGHEFVGEVIATGPDVEQITTGQRVVATSTVSDGTCNHCRNGRPSQCQQRRLFGYSGVYPRLDGGQAELVRVPVADRVLLPLDDAVSDEAAIFLADILPTAYGALQRAGTGLGDLVVIVGCGPVGLMATMCAKRLAANVISVDTIPVRREMAERLGARTASPGDSAALVDELSNGLGADVVIEAAGSPGGLTLALRLVRGRGIVSVVGAHFEPDYPLDNGLMFEREISLVFTIGDPFNDRSRLLDLMVNGVLDPTVVVSHRMPLEEAADAYALFDAQEATKIILECSS